MGEEAFIFLRNKYNIIYFCDNDRNKWGSFFYGVEVISPSALEQMVYEKNKIIIASMYSLEIFIQLINMGIKNIVILQRIKEDNGQIGFLEYELNEEMELVDEIEDIRKPQVACILDEFSYNSFKNDCLLIPINPLNWEKVLEKGIDFLFVESAWNGIKSEWKGLPIYFSNGYSKKNYVSELIDKIINRCQELDIPTVFWNKEDPVHYEKFLPLARKFQYIFTTDSNMIPKYIEDVGHNRVYVLPFAANLNIHNPINKGIEKIGELAFAGSWYEHHEERKKDMEKTLLPALEFGIHIYDRNYGITSNESLIFPEIYRKHIVGRLPYNKMVEYYKKYKIFLNTNTVQNSPTMFSRRVFELLACGTNVISGYSLGVEKMLGDVVFIGRGSEEIKKHITKLRKDQVFSEKLSILGIRKVVMEHTYTHRFSEITRRIKIQNYDEKEVGVSVITILTDEKYKDNVINNFNRQKYANKELIILIKSDDVKRLDIFDFVRNVNDVYLYNISSKNFPIEFLRGCTLKSNKDYISIFSEKDYYGEYYLIDSLNAFKYSKADIVGKATIFEFCQTKRQLSLKNPDNDNRYNNKIFQNTIVFEKNILFDSCFMDDDKLTFEELFNILLKKNFKVYSLDKFNYMCLLKEQDEKVDNMVKDNIDIKTAIEYISV